ncbi:MAG: thiamine pyrophosphate-binding protein, partial [Anaerolineales bacterium]|nr:thiamine pyrophosphate-binding protein [Anaerolineales bacterium]
MSDGGYLLVETLKRHGVNHIFTLSGLQTQSIYNACIDEGIHLIDTRHEQTAVFMADAWARATGHPGVALLSAGPGMTNGITGMVNAFASSSPAIVIAGKSPLDQSGMGAFQEVDQLSLVKPVTKWAASVNNANDIPVYVDQAFAEATSGRPGPTYVDIPVDVLTCLANEETSTDSLACKVDTDGKSESQVKQAFELLASAERPIILAGSGIRWANAAYELKVFMEAMGIPLVTIDMAKGVVPDDHPLCFGPVWTGLKYADVILICGTRLDYRLSYGQTPTFNEGVKVIQIDSEAAE